VGTAKRRTRTRLTPLGKAVVGILAATAVVVLVRWPWGSDANQAAGRPTHPPSARATSGPVTSPPACIYGDAVTDHAGYGTWDRTVLDTEFRLPRPYRPPDLVPISQAGFDRDLLVRSMALHDLIALRQAAAAAGHPLDVVAAYRSYQEQADLFERRQEQFGYDRSLDKTARPGHSEHQLGTAVDFKTFGAADVTRSWGSEPTGQWMSRNSYRYGFVLSYPDGRRSVTCYPYEPWHFRYIGPDLAAQFHGSGLTLREFLWRLNHS
jgi:D-alanyl-D-alanine carboxypeptidase